MRRKQHCLDSYRKAFFERPAFLLCFSAQTCQLIDLLGSNRTPISTVGKTRDYSSYTTRVVMAIRVATNEYLLQSFVGRAFCNCIGTADFNRTNPSSVGGHSPSMRSIKYLFKFLDLFGGSTWRRLEHRRRRNGSFGWIGSIVGWRKSLVLMWNRNRQPVISCREFCPKLP